MKILFVFLAVVLLATDRASASPSASGSGITTLAESNQPGPTLLLIDQPAEEDVSGAVALRQIARWKLAKGRILAASGPVTGEAIRRIAPTAIVLLAVEKGAATRPASAKKTSGSATPKAKAVADPGATLSVCGIDASALLAKLNALLDEGTPALQTADTPGRVSAGARTGADATADASSDTIAGTFVRLDFSAKRGAASPGERTRLFRHAVHHVLEAQGMTVESPWKIMEPSGQRLRVAIYAGGGSSTTPGLAAYPACLDRAANEIDYTYVGPAELGRPGMLDAFHVVVFCGGSGSGQAKSLGEARAAVVKDFVRRGGGYVSSCAGTYLATSGYAWSLKLVDADTIDSKHWARGSGPVNIELTEEGRKILGDHKGLVSIRYANGPLLGKAKDSGGLAPYTVLAHFRSDMAKNVPGGIMPGTPAMIAGACGEGRVLCFSPHPEYSEELRDMVVRAIKWAGRRS